MLAFGGKPFPEVRNFIDRVYDCVDLTLRSFGHVFNPTEVTHPQYPIPVRSSHSQLSPRHETCFPNFIDDDHPQVTHLLPPKDRVRRFFSLPQKCPPLLFVNQRERLRRTSAYAPYRFSVTWLCEHDEERGVYFLGPQGFFLRSEMDRERRVTTCDLSLRFDDQYAFEDSFGGNYHPGSFVISYSKGEAVVPPRLQSYTRLPNEEATRGILESLIRHYQRLSL